MSFIITCFQLLLLRLETIILIDRIIQLGEGIGDLPLVNVSLKTVSNPRILRIPLRQEEKFPPDAL